jgi:hypothetical protein
MEADVLVTRVMEARGYPMSTFEAQAGLISVDHPDVVENYRAARAARERGAAGQASTEDLREAVLRYRALFTELLRPDGAAATEHRPDGAAAMEEPDGAAAPAGGPAQPDGAAAQPAGDRPAGDAQATAGPGGQDGPAAAEADYGAGTAAGERPAGRAAP